MALCQFLELDRGGLLTVQPAFRPLTARISVYKNDGTGVVDNANASICVIATMIQNAVNARAKTIIVVNAANIGEGNELALRSPTEWVRAKKVTGNQISLWAPLREAHSNGAVLEATSVSYLANADHADTTWWDGRVRWELDDQTIWTAVECTRYPLVRVANEQTILAIHPQFATILEAEVDVEQALDAAHEHVLLLLGSKGRARIYPASTEFASATGLALARNHYRHQAGSAAKELFERYSLELDRHLEMLLASLPADEDMDAVAAVDEHRTYHSGRAMRG